MLHMWHVDGVLSWSRYVWHVSLAKWSVLSQVLFLLRPKSDVTTMVGCKQVLVLQTCRSAGRVVCVHSKALLSVCPRVRGDTLSWLATCSVAA